MNPGRSVRCRERKRVTIMTLGLILAVAGVLASPILWIGVSFVCSKIPFAADFLSKVFWELLGNVPVFETAAKVLEQALSYQQFSGSHFILTFLTLVFSSIMDSFIMGFSVFVFKAMFSKFSRQGMLLIPKGWLATALGVGFGALMTMGRDVLPDAFKEIFAVVLCVGLMLFGMGLMLGKPIRSYYAGARNRALGGMLMAILVDANLAWCCVSLTVCSLEGPRIVRATGDPKLWLAWYGLTILMYFVLDSAIFFINPGLRNSL